MTDRSINGVSFSSSKEFQPNVFNEHYQKIQDIGRGKFGLAATVRSKTNGKLFVMKRELLQVDDDVNKRRRHEVKALKKCKHENIVKYFDDIHETDSNNMTWSLIIMEFCPKGSFTLFCVK